MKMVYFITAPTTRIKIILLNLIYNPKWPQSNINHNNNDNYGAAHPVTSSPDGKQNGGFARWRHFRCARNLRPGPDVDECAVKWISITTDGPVAKWTHDDGLFSSNCCGSRARRICPVYNQYVHKIQFH